MGGYNQGYEGGKRDSAANEPRDATPPLVKSVISEQFRKEYTEGYRKGYDDQQFKKS